MAPLVLRGARLLDGDHPARPDAAGVRIVPGDDDGAVGRPHGSSGGELHTYVDDAGMDARTVLRWATRNGGGLLHRGAPGAGTGTPGALADLLVVDGDPSADIRLSRWGSRRRRRSRRPPGSSTP